MSDLRKAAQSAIDAYERLIPTLPGLKDSGSRWMRETLTKATDDLRTALAEPEQSEPVKFLANATRFKMAFFQNEDGEGNQTAGTHVTCFGAFEDELDGRWVALVPAEDDCHLKYTAPPAQTPDEMKNRPHDGGAYNNVLPAHVEASIRNQSGKCDTFQGCVKHGCHGACLPEDEPAASPVQTPPLLTPEQVNLCWHTSRSKADQVNELTMFARAIESEVRKQFGVNDE